MHEADRSPAGTPRADEAVFELLVGVPACAGGGQVAEHQLQGAGAGPGGGVGAVFVCGGRWLAMSLGGGGDLAAGGVGGQADQAQVEGGLAAVAGDLEHVVDPGGLGPGRGGWPGRPALLV